MLTIVSTRQLSAATLAARERRARAAMCRLRDCSREIERIAAGTRAARTGCANTRVEQRLRAFATEAARIRVELRTWDLGSPPWIEHLEARLDRLAAAIGPIAQATLTAGQEPLARPRHTPARDASTDQVERRVYAYLYPPTATAPAVG